MFVVAAILVAMMSIMAIGKGANANEGTIISIYADGIEKSVSTDVETVAEALEKVDVIVNDNDLVEPSIDTPINDAVFRINVYRARPVTVVDGETIRQVMTPYRSNRLMAADAGISVYDEDQFILERVDDIIGTGLIGQRLTIIRAMPMSIELYGKLLPIRTHSSTVEEILTERGIVIKEGDTVKPSLNSSIEAGETIRVVHTGTKVEAREEKIAFQTKTIYDDSLTSGVKKVKTAGENGIRLVTYEVVLENNKEVAKKELQSVVSKQPVTEVVIMGNKANSSLPQNASLEAWLLTLRTCESGGNYRINTGNSYYGAYQFLISTWDSIAQRVRPSLVGVRPDMAAPADQDFMIVQNTLMSTGGLASQNPGCYSKHGLSQFPPGM